jgi:hypothetical protein
MRGESNVVDTENLRHGLSPAMLNSARSANVVKRLRSPGTRHGECWSDDQAIEMARKEEGSHFGVQVWVVERPVCLVGNPRGNAAMHD